MSSISGIGANLFQIHAQLAPGGKREHGEVTRVREIKVEIQFRFGERRLARRSVLESDRLGSDCK
jgi:hypothetical protein